MKQFFSIVMALLFLSGCARTTLTSAWKLRNVRPETTNLQMLRFAVQIPKQFRFDQTGVALVLQSKKKQGFKARREPFVLERDRVAGFERALAEYQISSSTIYVYKIAAEDVGRFDRFRKWTKKNGLKGSMTIGPRRLCRLKVRLPKSILMSSFIKTQETKVFVPLAIDVDFLQELGHTDVRKMAPVCKRK